MRGTVAKRFRKDAFNLGLTITSTSGQEYMKERKAEYYNQGKPKPHLPKLSKRQERNVSNIY